MLTWLKNILREPKPLQAGRLRRGLQIVRARYDAAETNDANYRHWAYADGLSPDAANSPEVRRVLAYSLPAGFIGRPQGQPNLPDAQLVEVQPVAATAPERGQAQHPRGDLLQGRFHLGPAVARGGVGQVLVPVGTVPARVNATATTPVREALIQTVTDRVMAVLKGR